METTLTHKRQYFSGSRNKAIHHIRVANVTESEFNGLNFGVDTPDEFETFDISGCGSRSPDEVKFDGTKHDSCWKLYHGEGVPELMSIAVFIQYDSLNPKEADEFEVAVTIYDDDGEQIGDRLSHSFTA